MLAIAMISAWCAHDYGLITQVNGKGVIVLLGGANLAMAIAFLAMALRQVWLSPRDEILLMLVDDFCARNGEPDERGP